jgi:hypothetical protein
MGINRAVNMVEEAKLPERGVQEGALHAEKVEEETQEVGLIAMGDSESETSGSICWNEDRLIPYNECNALYSLLKDVFIHVQVVAATQCNQRNVEGISLPGI